MTRFWRSSCYEGKLDERLSSMIGQSIEDASNFILVGDEVVIKIVDIKLGNRSDDGYQDFAIVVETASCEEVTHAAVLGYEVT